MKCQSRILTSFNTESTLECIIVQRHSTSSSKGKGNGVLLLYSGVLRMFDYEGVGTCICPAKSFHESFCLLSHLRLLSFILLLSL